MAGTKGASNVRQPKPAAGARALSAIGARSAYLDGELCAVRPDGTTSFPEMQAATDAGRTDQPVYFAFDLPSPQLN